MKYYALINKLTTKPGHRSQVIDILVEAGSSFNDNPACILYLVNEDANNPNVLWVEDIWTSKEKHSLALASPELKSFIPTAMPLLENMPEQIEIVPVGGKKLPTGTT
jgi:quinol monooxygenase YgiN